jgi:hypothetical protein
MTHNPDALSCIFSTLKLVVRELEHAAIVWIRGVDKVKEVGLVPKVYCNMLSASNPSDQICDHTSIKCDDP